MSTQAYTNTGFSRYRALAQLIALVLPLVAMPALAITFTVNTTNDIVSGNAVAGSLRDGLIAVNASIDASNSIVFSSSLPANAHVALNSPLPLILNNVSIDGGSVYPFIDGQSTYRIFFIGVDSATQSGLKTQFSSAPLGNRISVTVRSMKLENGRAKGGNGGGGGMGAGGAVFINGAADVILDGVDLASNQAIGGNGTATINNQTSFIYNFGGGGGLDGNGGKQANYNYAGGGGIFGTGGVGASAAGGGGVFGNGAGYFGGGGGFTGNGGSQNTNGYTGTYMLAGISGNAGSGDTTSGGANGGGGGGGGTQNTVQGGGGGFGGGNGTTNVGGNGGFGGGAAGGWSNGGNGGFGGGGGSGFSNNTMGQDPSGVGGFGGGGATSSALGGHGGFGGGGGDGYGGGGAGGFGGGGGAACPGCGSNGGAGGFGGGNGAVDGSGGGAGFGGAVFVVGGGTLTFANSGMLDVNGNVTSGSAGASDAGTGNTGGSGLFLQGSGTLVFSPVAGQSQLMGDVIADETGSAITPPAGYTPGSWGVQKDGAGTLYVDVDTLYTGATTVNNGVFLEAGISVSPVTVNPSGVLASIGEFPSVTSSGTLVPGRYDFPQDNLAIDGDLTLQSGALACFHVGGTPTLSSSSITVSLDATSLSTLDGVARVDFAVTPGIGNSFAIIRNGSGNNTLSGKFGGLAIGPSSVDGKLSYISNGSATTSVNFVVTATDGLFRDGFDGGSNAAACIDPVP